MQGIDFDVCLFNEPPDEPAGCYGTHRNHQIVSTLNGIKHATRKYILKLRSESYLTGTEFIDKFDIFSKRSDQYRITKDRIVVMGYIDPYITLLPFYLMDTCFFGNREDILSYWDTPLAQPEAPWMFRQTPWWKKLSGNKIGDISCNNEQYYLRQFVNRYLEKSIEKTESLLKVSNRVVANNFVVLDGWNANQICSLKYPDAGRTNICINFEGWKILYWRYCDRSLSVGLGNIFQFYVRSLIKRTQILCIFLPGLKDYIKSKYPWVYRLYKGVKNGFQ